MTGLADFDMGYVGSDPILQRSSSVRGHEMDMVMVTLARSGVDSAVRIVGPACGSGEILHGVGRIVSNAAAVISDRFNLGYDYAVLGHMPRPFNPAGGMYLDVREPLWEVILHDRFGRAEDMLQYWKRERVGGPPMWPLGIVGSDFKVLSRRGDSFSCYGKWDLNQLGAFTDFVEAAGTTPFIFPPWEPWERGRPEPMRESGSLFRLMVNEPGSCRNGIYVHEVALLAGEDFGKASVNFSLEKAGAWIDGAPGGAGEAGGQQRTNQGT